MTLEPTRGKGSEVPSEQCACWQEEEESKGAENGMADDEFLVISQLEALMRDRRSSWSGRVRVERFREVELSICRLDVLLEHSTGVVAVR
jgi:hypothetical protein